MPTSTSAKGRKQERNRHRARGELACPRQSHGTWKVAKITSLWRTTPPAIFPICLGLMGLGLGWRNASDHLPVAEEFGGLLLGLAAAFFVFFLTSYLCKMAARPAVLFEDMTNPAARAGVAAAAMSMILLAAALLPFGISVPQVWWTGVILQIGASAVVCYAIRTDPPERRQFTPYQYLTFVGPVIGPVAGIPLGYVIESIVLILAALVAYCVITVGYAIRLTRLRPPLHLRPSLVIFLAPNCLFAIGFGLLEINWAFYIFFWVANVSALILLLLTPWLIKGGWSAVWSSFTFPTAAFLHVQVMAVAKGGGVWATAGVYAGLVVITPLILIISYRFVMLWVTGELVEQTGAAKA